MRFRNLLIFLGFLTIAIQFLGFPRAWDDMFYVAIGLLVMAFSYLAGKAPREASKAELRAEAAPETTAAATPEQA